MADMMYGSSTVPSGGNGVGGAFSGGDMVEENAGDYGYGNNFGMNNSFNNNQPRQRFPGLYVGNLTWWTTDKDVIEAINSIGVQDVQEVKFFENRNNGQSKGFCVVTFTSEGSLSTVLEKLPKIEIHEQNPVVTPYNRQNLNLFESQTNKPQRIPGGGVQGGPLNTANGSATSQHAAGIMGINSITGVHAAAAAAATVTGQLQFAGGIPNSNMIGGGLGVPRPPYQMRMRGHRPMLRGTGPGMNNGPTMPGGPRMSRYAQPQWQNSQTGGYNPRIQTSMTDMSNRLGNSGSSLKEDSGQGGEISSYYNPHHSSSNHHQHHHHQNHHHHQSDHYRSGRKEDSKRDRDGDRDSSSRREDRSSGREERSSGREERSSGREERSSGREERSSGREERSSKREERSSGREERSSKREERSSRRDRSEDVRRSRSRSRDKERARRDRDRRDRY